MGALEPVVAFFEQWDFWLCFQLHCLFAATMAPDLKGNFLLHYWTTFMAGFGGGFLSSLLIMRYDLAPFPLFGHNLEGVIWTASWWLVNCSPFDLVGRVVRLRPFMTLVSVGSAFCRAGLMAARVDLAVELYPGMVVPPLVLGTIAGFAGKIFLDCIRGALGHQSQKEDHEIMVPGFIWRSAFLGAALYYGMVHVWELLSPAEGLGLLRTVLVAHALPSNLLKMPLDFTVPFAAVFHTLSNVPRPSISVASPSDEDAAAKKRN